MKIRLAQDTDVGAITEIYNEAVLNSVATFDTEPKTVEERKNWFKKYTGPHPIYVAEIDTDHGPRVAGWASLSPFSDRCAYSATVENSVYIWPDFRGRKIGIALMEKLMAHAKEYGIHTILARVADGNEASLRLHRRFGFELVGVMREVGVKFGRQLDVHLLQVILT